MNHWFNRFGEQYTHFLPIPNKLMQRDMVCRNIEWKEVKQIMGSVNKVILVGNLTRNPEMKQTEGKKPVCVIGLATNRNWTDGNGHRHEAPEYHRVVAFDKLAETCHQYLTKGRKVYLEGRLQSHTYTGQDAIEKTGVDIVLEKMEMLDSMPQDVRQRMELQDALNDGSTGTSQQA
jgi:single-strand DNA-binding protein